MSLINTKKLKSSGFTIVELLIVVVIIGILAAITIVSFNGVQGRSKTASAQSAANTIQKKLEAFNAVNGSYPSNSANAFGLTSALSAVNEATLAGSGLTLTAAGANPTSANGTNTVRVDTCPTGYRITYYNFTTSTTTATTGGATCATYYTAS